MKVLKPFLCTFFLAVSLAFNTVGIEFETKSLLGNKIELKIPKDFVIMPEEMAKLKYPSERRPTLIYTSESGTINVALNLTSSRATQAQLPSYLENLLHIFRHSYTAAKEKFDGVKEINGRKVGFIEFSTSAVDTKIYNLIFFTDLNGQLLLCTVNCTEKNISEWQPAAKEIMASLKLK